MAQLLSTCVYARGQLNPQLFHYCAAVAFLHRYRGLLALAVAIGFFYEIIVLHLVLFVFAYLHLICC